MKRHDIYSFNQKLENKNIHYRILSEYPKDNHSQTEFICLIHQNIFIARPDNILSGSSSCEECDRERRLNRFINNLIKRNVKYKITGSFVDVHTKTQFYCEEHDCYFTCLPSNVQKGCNCCLICSDLYWTLDSYNDYLTENDRNILCHEFITSNDRTKHECLDCGHTWKQKPGHIIRGTGCPQCVKFGFDLKSSAILYYIEINYNDVIYYKIGITNKNVEDRFKSDNIKYNVLFHKTFDCGNDAKLLEQRILTQNKMYRYVGPKILRKGNTEIFIKDVFDGIYYK